MQLKKTILAAALLVAAASAASAADGKPYIAASAGLFIPADSTLTAPNGETATASFDAGYVVSGALGYAFNNGLRTELELAYRSADTDEIDVPGVGSAPLNSSVSAFSTLANVYYDFKNNSGFTPYVGGGLGFANVSVDDGSIGGMQVWKSDDANVFAFKAGAGVGIALARNTTLDLGYHYFGTESIRFDVVKAEVNTHNVTIGLRQSF